MVDSFPPWLRDAIDREVPGQERECERVRLTAAARAANVRFDEIFCSESSITRVRA